MKAFDNLYPARFAHHLPFVAKLVLSPALAFMLFALVGLGLSAFSIHYGLSLFIFGTVFFAFYLDRALLERVLIPPLGTVALWEGMGLGLGIGLIVYASGGKFDANLFKMQVAYLSTFPIICFAYRAGVGPRTRMTFPDGNPAFQVQIVRPLVFLGWGFFLWRVMQITVFAATGAEDRGDFGLVATNQYFGIWSYFNLFPRFNSTGFFLLPLVFARSGGPARVALIAVLGYYFMLAFATGARGNVFFPLIYIGVGAFFFRALNMIKLDLTAAIVALLIFPLVILMDHFRNTEAYRASRTIDLRARLSAVSEATVRSAEQKEKENQRENLNILGRALVGFSDPIIYESTPAVVPHAGAHNFSAVIYTWIPYLMFRDRPLLYDANIIMLDYMEGRVDRTGRAISLTADLYRRFGWLAVPVGLAVAFYVYGFVVRGIYTVYFRKDALLGVLLILYLFSYFQARPFSTVLTTWWNFAYELPKHLALLYLIYIGVKRVCGLGKIPGVFAFASAPVHAVNAAVRRRTFNRPRIR